MHRVYSSWLVGLEMGCLLIPFLVLLVAGEGVWTTKEGGGMNKEGRWSRTRNEGRSSRKIRETSRLYDCR